MKKVIFTVGIIAVLVGVAFAAMAAQPSPVPRIDRPTIVLDPTSGPVATPVLVTGTSWYPSQSVSIFFDQVGNYTGQVAITDSAGKFSATFVIPQTTQGTHYIVVLQKDKQVSAPFEVTGPSLQMVIIERLDTIIGRLEIMQTDLSSILKKLGYRDTTVYITPDKTTVYVGAPVTLTITEANTGNVSLTKPFVYLDPLGYALNKVSPEYVSGDIDNNGILDIGEVWCWVVISIVWEDTTFTATGHGTDPLGADITYPAYPNERDSVMIAVVVG